MASAPTTPPLTLNTARAAEERPYLEQTFGITDEQAFRGFWLRMAQNPEAGKKLVDELRAGTNGALNGVSDEEVARQFWNALPLEKKIHFYTFTFLWKSTLTWGAQGNRRTFI
jgi:hypothetical protein